MSETCIVPNCNSGHETGEERIAFFNIPQNVELRNKWINVIPTSGVPLSTTSMVCEKHFIETDIIRHYIVEDAAGKVVEKVAYDYPRLSDTAVPMIFPGLPLRLNEAQVQNSQQSTSQNTNNGLYDYMVMDMYTDIAAGMIKDSVSLIGSVTNHTQHKTNETEVVNRISNHGSENQPLLNTEAIQNNSSPSNGDILSDAAKSSSPSNGDILSDVAKSSSPSNGDILSDVAKSSSPSNSDILTEAAKSSSPMNGDVLGDAANHSTKAADFVLSNDEPVTTAPVPIFVQPTSMFALSDGPAADVTTTNDDDCCDCGDCDCDCGDCDCDCGDCSCDCDGCVLS